MTSDNYFCAVSFYASWFFDEQDYSLKYLDLLRNCSTSLPPEIFNQQISMLVYFILQLVTGEIIIWFCHLDDNFLNTPYVRVIMHKLHDKMKYKICHFRPRCAPHPGRTKLSHPWGSNDTKSSPICLCMRCFDLLYFRKTICLELHKEYI